MSAIHHTILGAICRRLFRGAGRMLTPVLLAMLGLMLMPGGARGGVLSFVSNPADAQLDGDPILDIEVLPGDLVDYFVTISTFGLANIRGGPFPGVLLAPVTSFSYHVDYDQTELHFDRVALDLLELFAGDIAVNDPVNGRITITHTAGNIAANNVRSLDQFFFTTLNPVNNGIADFGFSNVLINGVTPPAGVFTFDQVDEVQPPPPKPAPEPATLLLLGGAIIALLSVLPFASARRRSRD